MTLQNTKECAMHPQSAFYFKQYYPKAPHVTIDIMKLMEEANIEQSKCQERRWFFAKKP
jgi:hypothetical protein